MKKLKNTESAQLCSQQGARAGSFWYFLIFSTIKNDFFAVFIKLITNFSAPVLFKMPTPCDEFQGQYIGWQMNSKKLTLKLNPKRTLTLPLFLLLFSLKARKGNQPVLGRDGQVMDRENLEDILLADGFVANYMVKLEVNGEEEVEEEEDEKRIRRNKRGSRGRKM